MTDGSNISVHDRGIAGSRGGAFVQFWNPLHWSAVIGGAVTALGIQIMLTLLGVGLGISLSGPRMDTDSPQMLAAPGIAWLIISGLISFGAGGWVAGHMSGVLRNGSGFLHGITAWALAAVFGVAVATLAGSTMAGGAAAGVGAGAGASMSGGAWGLPSSLTPSSTTSRHVMADGTVRLSDTYGRSLTEAEARAAAETARRLAAQTALWTGAAFLLAMIAAGVGGRLGRMNTRDALVSDTTGSNRVVPTAAI